MGCDCTRVCKRLRQRASLTTDIMGADECYYVKVDMDMNRRGLHRGN